MNNSEERRYPVHRTLETDGTWRLPQASGTGYLIRPAGEECPARREKCSGENPNGNCGCFHRPGHEGQHCCWFCRRQW
jgi:hypothetical protein